VNIGGVQSSTLLIFGIASTGMGEAEIQIEKIVIRAK
jgi:hypothetical protein